MRKIKDLLERHEKVWFYLEENEQTKLDFVNEVNSEGFSDGSPLTRENISRIMSVNSNGHIAYVSAMAWAASFELGNGSTGINHNFSKILKVDFAKYRNGVSSYLL